jgi:cation diffusion facilitator family transporter
MSSQAASTTAAPGDAHARERSALVSVAAAIVLVAVKLVAGLAAGSLALIAEAAHSATDLVAALLTLFAVRVAVRPPDQEHHYGHGKAEHLAALGESSFLGLVSLLLGYESIRRLADGSHGVEAAWWTFAVLAFVIVLDGSRAYVSWRTARRVGSPALAANALHFASDLTGSFAVLIGLILVAAGHPNADAIAALFVAVLVIVAASRLFGQSVQVLMDRTSADAERTVRDVVAGLRPKVDLRRLRVRHAAGRHFVDLVVGVPLDAGVGQAHATADDIETAVGDALDGAADTVVHVEPRAPGGDLRERASAAATEVAEVREVHNVRVLQVEGGHELSLHVKLPPDLSLSDAHGVVERLERRIREAVPELRSVHTHIEPLSGMDRAERPRGDDTREERAVIEETVRSAVGTPPTAVAFRDAERGRIALITIALPGGEPLPAAHRQAGEIEEAVRERCPGLADVIVRTAPDENGAVGY